MVDVLAYLNIHTSAWLTTPTSNPTWRIRDRSLLALRLRQLSQRALCLYKSRILSLPPRSPVLLSLFRLCTVTP